MCYVLKCGLKLITYMQLNFPLLSSALAVHLELIMDETLKNESTWTDRQTDMKDEIMI